MSSLRPVSGTTAEVSALLRAWHEETDPEPLVIATSGSTGRPKRVLLSRSAMQASVAGTRRRLGADGPWVLNLPSMYVAGVQVLYRSVVAGREPVLFEESYERTLAGVEAAFVSLVPTQLVRLLRDERETAALAGHTAVVGGGPLDPAVRRRAEDAGIRVVQTYGMSETCGGCVYDGVPLDGVEVRIDDDQVLLRGPVLFDGYEGDPERTAAAFRDGWLVTDDLGHLDDDGRLHVDGRADQVIISGGLKVPPLPVERALRRHPDVEDALVLGMPDPEWGERVVAVVTGRRTHLPHDPDSDVPRTWWPKQVVWLDELPRLENGKPDRRTVVAMLLELSP